MRHKKNNEDIRPQNNIVEIYFTTDRSGLRFSFQRYSWGWLRYSHIPQQEVNKTTIFPIRLLPVGKSVNICATSSYIVKT